MGWWLEHGKWQERWRWRYVNRMCRLTHKRLLLSSSRAWGRFPTDNHSRKAISSILGYHYPNSQNLGRIVPLRCRRCERISALVSSPVARSVFQLRLDATCCRGPFFLTLRSDGAACRPVLLDHLGVLRSLVLPCSYCNRSRSDPKFTALSLCPPRGVATSLGLALCPFYEEERFVECVDC